MIVVFGSDGFLGDRMVSKLQSVGRNSLSCKCDEDAVAQDFTIDSAVVSFADKDDFFRFIPAHYREVDWVIYCDKRLPNTTLSVFRMEFVQKLWTLAASYSLSMLYAFHLPMESPVSDFQSDRFAQWVEKQYRKPPFWYIFRVGEVYGRHEDDFGECVSRVYKFYQQILEKGEATLPDPEQEVNGEGVMRDYLYVQDAVRVFYWYMLHHPENGVYDLGSGFERTDFAVVNAIFRALKLPPRIRYVDPSMVGSKELHGSFLPDLRKLRGVGFRKPFYSVEKGIKSFLRRPR
jgi:ADP-L-glycero-D-manno-heptose 6-epimerase